MAVPLSLCLALALPAEPLERSLLRGIPLGVLQVDAAEALRHARAPETDFTGHVLARAALAAAGHGEGFPEWPLPRLLQRALDLVSAPETGLPRRDGLPDGLGDAELVLVLVYTLAVTGQAEAAEDVLEANLKGATAYKAGVVLQSLRNIGDPRSTSLIQRFVEGGDVQNLGENLLADLQFPFLHDLRDRLSLIPPEHRTRGELRALAAEPPGERSALAVYFLGFLPATGRPAEERAELDLLRRLTGSPHFMVRTFAARALALRSPETAGFWADLLRRQDDPWQRAQTARIGFALHGRGFARAALELLATEPSQYAQWELMHGTLEVRRGRAVRTPWDLWLPTTLQLRLNFPRGGGEMGSQDVDEILEWLEGGARPRDQWVRTQLFYGLVRHVAGPAGARYLRLFGTLPDRPRHYWMLDGLRDPAALPLLRRWLAEPIPDPAQRQALERLIERLEGLSGPAPRLKIS